MSDFEAADVCVGFGFCLRQFQVCRIKVNLNQFKFNYFFAATTFREVSSISIDRTSSPDSIQRQDSDAAHQSRHAARSNLSTSFAGHHKLIIITVTVTTNYISITTNYFKLILLTSDLKQITSDPQLIGHRGHRAQRLFIESENLLHGPTSKLLTPN